MKLGFVTDCLADVSLEPMLEHAARLGVDGVELSTGGWSDAPHVDLAALASSAQARRAFRAAFEAFDLDIVCLNVPGNPLHPTERTHADCLVDTLRLAGDLGIPLVCATSGLPAGGPEDRVPNWLVTAGPQEVQDSLRYQWEDALTPFWEGIAVVSRDAGVSRIALDLCGNQCVYNPASLMKLREAVGPLVGAALNPGHLAWMGADPLQAAGTLGEAIYHVHARDTLCNPVIQANTGLLDTGSLEDVAARAWTHVTAGYGYSEPWWHRFCHRLRGAGYDGWLSIDHEDAVIDALEALEKSVALFRRAMPAVPTDEAD